MPLCVSVPHLHRLFRGLSIPGTRVYRERSGGVVVVLVLVVLVLSSLVVLALVVFVLLFPRVLLFNPE